MARPLRIEYEGAWYHVMNRGAARQNIFTSVKHYNLFLQLLLEIKKRFQVEIHAYCLMPNHYHLLIRTPLPNLSNAMRHIVYRNYKGYVCLSSQLTNSILNRNITHTH